jgi:hypothetical protein
MYAKYNLTVGASLHNQHKITTRVGISPVGGPVERERLCIRGAFTPALQSLLCNP